MLQDRAAITLVSNQCWLANYRKEAPVLVSRLCGNTKMVPEIP
jgi:hypothetical protein